MEGYVFAFNFRELEASNRRLADEHHGEHLRLLARVMTDAYAGFSFLGGIPRIEQRQRRTLIAALLSRSFKSLTAALELAVRGYYVQSLTLTRSLHENHLVMWDVQEHPSAAEAIWNGEWPRERSFWNMAKEFDEWIVKRGHRPGMRERWMRVYGRLSEVAHPRGPALAMEFDDDGLVLETAPNWHADRCQLALGLATTVCVEHLILLKHFVGPSPECKDWQTRTDSTVQAVTDWLARQP